MYQSNTKPNDASSLPLPDHATREAALFLAAGYAIVDIETTGGSPADSGITEVAILLHDGEKVTGRYETLINPELEIPFQLQRLTGISNEMVRHSPVFGEVAKTIYELLSKHIFVAHNVDFDYSFLKHHLRRAGYRLEVPRLCTVRISRKIKPGLKSYSLGNLCAALGIPLIDRHRAGGDADATAILFGKMHGWDKKGLIPELVRGHFAEAVLPPNLPPDDIHAIPPGPGVYHLKNEAGAVLYVGKSANLQKGIRYRFAHLPQSGRLPDLLPRIFSVSWETCATDLIASLLEISETRLHQPRYNRLPKSSGLMALYTYENAEGFLHLVIGKAATGYESHLTFDTPEEAAALLNRLVRQFGLSPLLCSPDFLPAAILPGTRETALPASPEAYNRLVHAALSFAENSRPSFAILDKGRNRDEKSCVWIENGVVTAVGYLDLQSDLTAPEDLRQSLSPYPDNSTARRLVTAYAQKNPAKVWWWKRSHP